MKVLLILLQVHYLQMTVLQIFRNLIVIRYLKKMINVGVPISNDTNVNRCERVLVYCLRSVFNERDSTKFVRHKFKNIST